jgi:secondary thiamine-phosphate synthase enzyme
MLQKFHLRTRSRSQMINITEQVREAIRQSGAVDGFVTVYCPHTTAGITINEGADSDVVRDILLHLDELFPWEHPQYRHGEGNSAAHLKASTIGASQAIPVVNSEAVLGIWQAIFFCEFDGPRHRTFLVKVIQG